MTPAHDPGGPYVFSSYASADRERALALADQLNAAGVPAMRRAIGNVQLG